MLLISLLLAVFVKQLLGEWNPLHRDGWVKQYSTFASRLRLTFNLSPQSLFPLAASLIAIAAILLSSFLAHNSPIAYTLFAAAILLYSFGRGPYDRIISEFIVAEAKNDWDDAASIAKQLGVDSAQISLGDWHTLNKQFLEKASYKGFERFFAVAFWFAVLGPAGAFIYRFSHLWHEQLPCAQCQRWLWLIEWPAVRILGLSYAVTGNFAGTFEEWKQHAKCIKRSSQAVLLDNLLGALSVDEKLPQSQEVTRRELDALQALLSRTLWFWLGAIALIFLML